MCFCYILFEYMYMKVQAQDLLIFIVSVSKIKPNHRYSPDVPPCNYIVEYGSWVVGHCRPLEVGLFLCTFGALCEKLVPKLVPYRNHFSGF